MMLRISLHHLFALVHTIQHMEGTAAVPGHHDGAGIIHTPHRSPGADGRGLGIVRGVDDSGSIMVAWDGGGSLHVLYGVDECRKVVE